MLFGFVHVRHWLAGDPPGKLKDRRASLQPLAGGGVAPRLQHHEGILGIGREVHTSDDVRFTSSMRRSRCLANSASQSVPADQWLTESAGNRESHRSRQYSIR